MDFKIKGETIPDMEQRAALKQKAMLEYFKRGYKQPNYALTVIDEVYNDIYTRETIKAQAEADAKGKYFTGLSTNKTETIDILKDYTEIKLYKELTRAFREGEEFSLTFENGKPDEATASFFNLEDVVGKYVNITRTTSVRTPVRFHAEERLEVMCTPEGDFLAKNNEPPIGPSVDNTDLIMQGLMANMSQQQ